MSNANQELSSYLQIVTRRWWLILLLPAVTAIVILALSGTSDSEYMAYTRLQILPVDSQEVPLFSQTRFVASSEQIQAVHDEFYDVVRLPSVAWKTIADLELSLSADELISRIDTQHQTDFVTVSAQMQTPDLAQQVLTAQVENALNTYRGIRSKPAEISLEFIEIQLSEQSQTLAAAQEALQQFQLETEVADLNREIAAFQDLRRTLQSDRDRAVIEAKRNERLATEYQMLADANRGKAEAARAATEPDPAELAEAESLLVLARGQQRSAEEHAAIAEGYRASVAEYDRVLEERQQELIYLLGLQENYEGLVAGVARRSQLCFPCG